MDIHAQFVPDSQRRGVAKMMDMVAERKARMLSQESAVVN